MSVSGLGHVGGILGQVLTDFGRRSADDPRRLRGLLTDTLGAEASEYQSAVDAIVVAAEAGVPQAALGDVGRDELIGLLGDRFDPDSAGEIVDLWMTALRVQDRVPTDGPTVAPVPLPGPGAEATQLPTELAPSSDDLTLSMPAATVLPSVEGEKTRAGVAAFMAERKVAVLSVAGVLVLALGGIGAASMFTGGTGTTTTTAPEATTTTESTTTTSEASLGEVAFEEELAWGVTVDRVWRIEGNQLVMSLAVETGDEAAGGYVWEFLPPSLGVDATTLTFLESDIITAVYSNESVVALVLALPSNTTWSYEYQVPLPSGALDDPEFLLNLLTEWDAAKLEFMATPPPSLEVTSDTPVGDKVTIRGTTTPGVELQIAGGIVEVAADGTFVHGITLGVGENVVLVRAVDRVRGQATSEELRWTYTPPTTTVTTKPPSSGSPTPTTPGAVNQAPYLTGDCTNPNSFSLDVSSGSGEFYNAEWCFADPDGDTLTFVADAAYGTLAAAGFVGDEVRWTYYPTLTCPYEDTVDIWVKDPAGLTSGVLVFYITATGC